MPDHTTFAIRVTHVSDSNGEQSYSSRIGAGGEESLLGYVLEVAHPLLVPDLLHESRFSDLILRRHGVRSALAAPLKLPERSFGAMAACSLQPREFDSEDVLFIETISHLVATTIARSQAEHALAKEQKFTAGLLQTVEALVLVLDEEGRVLRSNPACERITGFTVEELYGRPIVAALAVAEDVPKFSAAFRRLKMQGPAVQFESQLLTKHGQTLWIAWNWAALGDSEGEIGSVFATGINITRQHELEEKLQQLPSHSPPQQSSTFLAPAINVERRKRPRRSYPYRQWVAPMVGHRLPSLDQFVEVLCNDIGAGGFSFTAATPPTSDRLVVALGNPPRLTYLIAQVVHVNRTRRQGEQGFLIGCNYIGRASYPHP